VALRYPRTARLLKPGDFAALRKNAKRIHGVALQIEYRFTDAPTARLGMAVSRRVSKLAVVRNRIRRTVRESFRLHYASLPSCDILVVARTVASTHSNQTLRDELDGLWRKLTALKQTAAPVKMPPGS
jgi:ribonuclease P protein component